MRFGARRAWLAAVAAAALATAAAAQPVIVDPDPDSDFDWNLRLESVVAGLDSPSAVVFLGPRVNEEFLVLEKNTGRVRRFVRRIEQPVALDLAVDNCGERGLVDIALHPFFDPTPTPVTDPPTDPPRFRPPNQDWVYLAYHTDAGRTGDGCDGNAVLRVERFKWDIETDTLVPDPLTEPVTDPETEQVFGPFTTYTKDIDADVAVGGALTTDVQITGEFEFRGRLYISIGSLGRTTGLLQNDEAAPAGVFDDTSVVLRFDENGVLPSGNPFDDDPDVIEDDDYYYLYGVRSPRRMAIDPFSSFTNPMLWLTDQNDGGPAPMPDEIQLGTPGSNSGYSDYQGRIADPLEPGEEGYPLVDLAEDAGGDPDGTFLNPRFSFEDKGVDPLALEFGGLEVGAQHIGALFVGATNGQLFRFALNSSRLSFVLGNPNDPEESPLADTVASPTDDLSTILVAEGFGAISDVARGVDGSLYILDATNGTVHHLFSEARRDLALAKLKVPRRVTLKPDGMGMLEAKKSLRVTIENRGEVIERILSREELETLLQVQVTPVPGSTCAPLEAVVVTPWYASPPYEFAIGIKPRGKLTLEVDVTWRCDTPTPLGEPDFETTAEVDALAIGSIDDDPSNNVCPRQPDPARKDKGCGAKDASGMLVAPATDLIEK